METTKEYLTLSELEIEARAKAATPGPWEPEKSEPTTKEEMKRYAAKCIDAGNNTQYALVMYHGNGGWDICHTGNGESSIANAEFIAHSRADIPALLSTLRAERAKLERQATNFMTALRKEWATRAELERELDLYKDLERKRWEGALSIGILPPRPPRTRPAGAARRLLV